MPQNLSCLLCLEDNHTKYYNLCGVCNNFIICVNCYNRGDTHNIKVCSMCRRPLVKIDADTLCTNIINALYHMRYIIIYIFLVIIPSHLMLIDYPDDMVSPYFTTSEISFALTISFNCMITIPFIITYYYCTNVMLSLYSFLSCFFLLLKYVDNESTDLQFYTMYVIVYYYVSIYGHLFIIISTELTNILIDFMEKYINKQNLKIKIYDVINIQDRRRRNRVSTTTV